MACHYCGKEIGPIHQLRDAEFCSSAHRKEYSRRLSAVLGRIGAPGPSPSVPAGFAGLHRPDGADCALPARISSLMYSHSRLEIPQAGSIILRGVAGESFRSLGLPAAACPGPPAVAECAATQLFQPPRWFAELALQPSCLPVPKTPRRPALRAADRRAARPASAATRSFMAFRHSAPAAPEFGCRIAAPAGCRAAGAEPEIIAIEAGAVAAPAEAAALRFPAAAPRLLAPLGERCRRAPMMAGPQPAVPGLPHPLPAAGLPLGPVGLAAWSANPADSLPALHIPELQPIAWPEHAPGTAGLAAWSANPADSLPALHIPALQPIAWPEHALGTAGLAAWSANPADSLPALHIPALQPIAWPECAPAADLPPGSAGFAAASAHAASAASPGALVSAPRQAMWPAHALALPASFVRARESGMLTLPFAESATPPVAVSPSGCATVAQALAWPPRARVLPECRIQAAEPAWPLPEVPTAFTGTVRSTAGFPAAGTFGPSSLPASFTAAVTMTAAAGLLPRAPQSGTGAQTETASSRHPAPGESARAEWPLKEAQMSERPILPGAPWHPPLAAPFAATPSVRAAESLPDFNWTPAPETAAAPPPSMPDLALDPAPYRPPVAPPVRDAGAPEPQGFIPVQFHCQRGSAAPSRLVEWHAAGLAVVLPRLELSPVFDSIEEKPAPLPVPKRRTPAVVRITGARKAFRQFAEARQTHALAAAAAGLLLVALLWFGPRAPRIANLMATNQITAETDVPGGAGAQETPGGPAPAAGPNGQRKQAGWLRRAVKERAAVQLSDNFRNGMQAWDTRPGTQAGWQHRSGGYVQTGQLALYRPSASFADYQLDFFGQIESRSMGWVMRAHDTNNYYAMKVSVIDPGLRTMIGIEHYPVIGGHKGHRVVSPLNVMVHRGKPVLVSVAVKGNRFTASIDGQEVDSWADQAPSTGGVGFFSEAGERARLYWMRVSKNQDLLGRLCAYLASGPSTSTAGLHVPELPTVPVPAGGIPLPQPPAMLALFRGPGVRPPLPEWRRVSAAAVRPHIILLSRRIEPCRS